MERKKIILDCDPGHDDAVAIMLAAGSEELELLGVTVVAGNQTLENTVRNACNVLSWIGREDIPVRRRSTRWISWSARCSHRRGT